MDWPRAFNWPDLCEISPAACKSKPKEKSDSSCIDPLAGGPLRNATDATLSAVLRVNTN
jgi:hypothetical protein